MCASPAIVTAQPAVAPSCPYLVRTGSINGRFRYFGLVCDTPLLQNLGVSTIGDDRVQRRLEGFSKLQATFLHDHAHLKPLPACVPNDARCLLEILRILQDGIGSNRE